MSDIPIVLCPGTAADLLETRRADLMSISLRRAPTGAVLALVLGIAVHLIAAWVHREPVAHPYLRAKVGALTIVKTPSLIFAGDSTFMRGVLPSVVAEHMDLPANRVMNMAAPSCDTTAVLAAHREFSHRFAPSRTLVLDVASFGANDAATGLVGPELLSTLPFRDRLKVTTPRRALTSFFIPEEALWNGLIILNEKVPPEYAPVRQGIRENMSGWSPQDLSTNIDVCRRLWYPDLRYDGVRWARMQQDVRTFARLEHRLILVIMPFHPAYVRALEGTPPAFAERKFRERIHDLCRELNVPCLDYDENWCAGSDPNPLFVDVVHLSPGGARQFSTRLARDLRALGIH